jgi:uncharacterized protein YabE (DUF348 family)
LIFTEFCGKIARSQRIGGLMIDKPESKTGILVDKFLKWSKDRLRHIKNKRMTRAIVVTMCTLALTLVIVGFATPKTVTVHINDSTEILTQVYETTSFRVNSFVKNHNVDYVPEQDQIDVDLLSIISDGMEINITKADGDTTTITTLPITVQELLENADIDVGEDDIVEPELTHILQKGDQVQVKRVTFEEVSEEEEIPYTTTKINDYSVQIGTSEVKSEGVTGLSKKTYKVMYVDGEETSRELIDTQVLKEKQDKVIAVGTRSNLGIPEGLQYTKKISGVKAVAYYFSGNPVGAYGLPCKYGTVAVDPSVIPLGTRLYIEGYGYAIANDTGSSIKGNIVDLYMESYSQCCQWGARTVNVYILD